MLHKYLLAPLTVLTLLAASLASAQAQTGGVRIGTAGPPDAKAALEIAATDKGLLVPRLTAAQRTAIAASGTMPAGLLVYQTDGVQPGFWYYEATAGWTFLNPGGDNLGNHLATQALNLQGQALTGTGASISGVGVGIRADGGLNLGQNGVGNNLLLGYQAGQSLTSSVDDGTGLVNQFGGYQSGQATTVGTANLFSGYQSGYSNTSGTGNQFLGFQSGYSNTTGDGNLFSGYHSGHSNTEGFANHFDGVRSGFANTTGYNNQYLGNNAGANSTTGRQNLFVGYGSGLFNETGSDLTALGANSGPDYKKADLENATALGANTKVTQSNTVVLGTNARVGIGTSEPEEKLQVVGTIYSSAGGFKFPDGTTQTTAATAGSADNLGNHTATQSLKLNGNTLSNNGTGGISIDSDGQVGVGTASPAGPFQVNGQRINPAGVGVDQAQLQSSGSSNVRSAIQSFTAGGSDQLVRVELGMHAAGADEITFNVYDGAGTSGTLLSTQVVPVTNRNYSSTVVYQSIVLPTPVPLAAGQVYTLRVEAVSGQVYLFFQSNNPYAGGEGPGNLPGTDVDLVFKTYTTQPAAVESVPALTVLQYNNVGINTASPRQPLEVAGTVYSSSGGFMFPDGTIQTTAATAGSADNVGGQSLKLNGNTLMGNGGTTGLTVAANGNVGIGTTAAQPATQKLEVNGQVRITGGGPAAGRVLTSDAGGTATWADPATPNVRSVTLYSGPLTSLPASIQLLRIASAPAGNTVALTGSGSAEGQELLIANTQGAPVSITFGGVTLMTLAQNQSARFLYLANTWMRQQ